MFQVDIVEETCIIAFNLGPCLAAPVRYSPCRVSFNILDCAKRSFEVTYALKVNERIKLADPLLQSESAFSYLVRTLN